MTIPPTINGLTVTVIGIGEDVFSGGNPTSISIPATVTTIADNAFSGCGSVQSFTIPDSLTSIGESVFDGWSALTSITIPSSVTSLGSNEFDNCASLSEITVDPDNPSYSSVNGVLFDKSQTMLLQYPINNTANSCIVPSGVADI